jgi:hypothetical protein
MLADGWRQKCTVESVDCRQGRWGKHADCQRIEPATSVYGISLPMDYYMRLLLSGGKATLSAGDSSNEGRRAAMRIFALDVGFKRTAVCVVDEAGRIVWRGVVDTHPEALSRALQRWGGKLANDIAKSVFQIHGVDARPIVLTSPMDGSPQRGRRNSDHHPHSRAVGPNLTTPTVTGPARFKTLPHDRSRKWECSRIFVVAPCLAPER